MKKADSPVTLSEINATHFVMGSFESANAKSITIKPKEGRGSLTSVWLGQNGSGIPVNVCVKVNGAVLVFFNEIPNGHGRAVDLTPVVTNVLDQNIEILLTNAGTCTICYALGFN